MKAKHFTELKPGEKYLGYAYATSPIAVANGFAKTGCWYVYTNEWEPIFFSTSDTAKAVEYAEMLPETYDRYSFTREKLNV